MRDVKTQLTLWAAPTALLAALLATGWTSPAMAQSQPPQATASPAAPSPQQPDETVVVTATRVADRRTDVGVSISVVGPQRLRDAGSEPVADVLRAVPGVSMTRNGGPGGFAAIRLRGGEGDQTLVLLDGVRLSDPSSPGGGFSFATLLVGDLERIEVLRGPQSTLFGSQAIGGVIHLISPEPGAEGLEGSAALEAGELDTRAARLALRTRIGPVALSASAGRFETDGISAAARGTETDGLETTAARVRARAALGSGLSLEAGYWWADSDAGIDGFAPPTFALGDTPERTLTREQVVVTGGSWDRADGGLSLKLLASRSSIARDSVNPTLAQPLTFGAEGTTDTLSAQAVWQLAPGLRLTGGGETERSRIDTASPGFPGPGFTVFTARTETRAAFLEARLDPTPWLTATIGARATDHDRFGEALNARATLSARLSGGSTIIRFAAADAFKAPTLFQLFSNFGNPDLAPEEASAIEAGVEQRLLDGRLVVGITAFTRSSTNQIDFVSCTGSSLRICAQRPFGTYDNIARARADGIEVTADWQVADRLALSLAYTGLEATARSGANTGRELPRRPGSVLSLGVRWTPVPALDLDLGWTRTGASFDDAGNRVRLAGYDLIALRASWQVAEGWSLYGRIDNAGDETYQTTAGYGASPRQIVVGVRASF